MVWWLQNVLKYLCTTEYLKKNSLVSIFMFYNSHWIHKNIFENLWKIACYDADNQSHDVTSSRTPLPVLFHLPRFNTQDHKISQQSVVAKPSDVHGEHSTSTGKVYSNYSKVDLIWCIHHH